MPRRKTSDLPASWRISAPSLPIRLAICFSLKAFLIRFLNSNLVELAPLADFEELGDLYAGQQHDLSAPQHERNPVAELARNFTINQEILQLFLARHAERLESVAVAAIADGKFGVAVLGKLEALRGGQRPSAVRTAEGGRPPHANRSRNLRDVGRVSRAQLDLERFNRLRFSAQDPL